LIMYFYSGKKNGKLINNNQILSNIKSLMAEAAEDRQALLEGNNDPDYIDFEAPEINDDALPSSNTKRNIGKQQRIVLKYPDGSQSLGKLASLNQSQTQNRRKRQSCGKK